MTFLCGFVRILRKKKEMSSLYNPNEGIVGDVDPYEWDLFGLGPGKQ